MLHSYDIKRQIDLYNNKIFYCHDQMRIYKNQLEELYSLKSHYINIENTFHEYQYHHRNKAKRIEECIPHFRFSKRFSETIIEVVNGYAFENTLAKIENVQARIERKIQELVYKNDECKNNIIIFQGRISDLEYQLKSILNKEW